MLTSTLVLGIRVIRVLLAEENKYFEVDFYRLFMKADEVKILITKKSIHLFVFLKRMNVSINYHKYVQCSQPFVTLNIPSHKLISKYVRPNTYAFEIDNFLSVCFYLLTSTIVPGITYFVVISHPLHQVNDRSRGTNGDVRY